MNTNTHNNNILQSSIVTILNLNGQVWILRDFKKTVNPDLQIDDSENRWFVFYSRIGYYFTRLNLNDVYLQVPLDKESQKLTTINTHEGLFCILGCVFWLLLHQEYLNELYIKYFNEYQRQLLIMTTSESRVKTMEKHNSLVFKRLRDDGLCLRGNKCKFKKSLISYLGHIIDAEVIHPTQEKANAIQKAPTTKMCRKCVFFFFFF